MAEDVEILRGTTTHERALARGFGPIIERGGLTVIPVAMVAGVVGPDVADGEAPMGSRSHARRGVVRPLGIYVLKDGRARWIPAVNATAVAIATIALIALLARIVSRRRAGAPPEQLKRDPDGPE